jgi:metal-sulfur cluster biosynthetic enzyme
MDQTVQSIQTPEQVEKVGDSPVDGEAVLEALRQCYDPEIPVNVVDLGLIY